MCCNNKQRSFIRHERNHQRNTRWLQSSQRSSSVKFMFIVFCSEMDRSLVTCVRVNSKASQKHKKIIKSHTKTPLLCASCFLFVWCIILQQTKQMILAMPFRCIGDTSLAKVHQISLSHLREKMTRLRQKPNGGRDGQAEILSETGRRLRAPRYLPGRFFT